MEYRIFENVVNRFREVIEKFPNKIAIEEKGLRITYEQLDIVSNKVACYLQQSGVKNGSSIAFLLPRSINTIAVILGILKLRCHYVPLSRNKSLLLVNQMLSDNNIDVVITDKEAALNCKQIIRFGDIFCHSEVDLQIAMNIAYDPLDPIYIMFTSGTTGQAKGVIVSHHSVVNLVSEQNYVELDPNDCILQLSPLEFDGSTFEIWGALLNGAKLVLYPDQLPTLSTISDYIECFGISIIFITTQLFNSMVVHRASSLVKVRQILFGGESASTFHVNEFMKLRPFRLTNIYGPTECTTFTTYFQIKEVNPDMPDIPIGKPINGVNVFISNSNGPDFETDDCRGELLIGGQGVSNGYANYSRLTAENFVNDLSIYEYTGVLYKSGDIVKYDEDRNLYFLGRIDRIVKNRGYKVSLGAIESEIKKYPQVESVAVKYTEVDNDRILSAWVCPSDENTFDVKLLKKYLKNALPQPMVPNAIYIVNRMPLTSAGKIKYEDLVHEH